MLKFFTIIGVIFAVSAVILPLAWFYTLFILKSFFPDFFPTEEQ